MEVHLRKRKTLHPCPICFLHVSRCICPLIPKLDLQTRVTLVVHAKELKRTTNTGRLAIHALKNSEMIVRGQDQNPLNLSSLISDEYETYLLYPSEDAQDLSSIQSSTGKPVHLIVPDGNWRQASKVHTRHPELKSIPRVKLTRFEEEGNGSLRKEHLADGMATLEAIALAMASLEDPVVARKLLDLYRAKLRATLEGRQPASKGSSIQ
jgi:DTW domain-containing protein YfiP